MGMFDYVKYKAPCKKCGEMILRDWQTKDSDCLLNNIEADPNIIQHWYTSCPSCGTWNAKKFKVLTYEIIDDEIDLG